MSSSDSFRATKEEIQQMIAAKCSAGPRGPAGPVGPAIKSICTNVILEFATPPTMDFVIVLLITAVSVEVGFSTATAVVVRLVESAPEPDVEINV